MIRTCIKYPIESFLCSYPELSDRQVELFIDENNASEILDFLEMDNHRKKFRLILFQILNFRYDNDLYGKEEVSYKSKNITAMKFTRKGENVRIYCKEFFRNNKKIVMLTTCVKKSERNNKKIISILESLGEYEYDFE